MTKTKMMKCPRGLMHIPNWKGVKPKDQQKHASDTFYSKEEWQLYRKSNKPIAEQEVEFKSAIGGLFYQCSVCRYMVRAPKEEADKVVIEAFTNALKRIVGKSKGMKTNG